jgi:hypothetical protein
MEAITPWLAAKYAPLFATLCFVATALWVGTLFSVSWLSGRARMMADGPEIGRLSVSLFRRWTAPSLILGLAAGVAWCAATRGEIPRDGWLYGVAVAVLAQIGLSAAVGHRARRVMGGSFEATKGEGMRRFALLVSLWATVALATFRSSLVP